jgi:hypothetical protein
MSDSVNKTGAPKRRNAVQEKSYAFASIHDDGAKLLKLPYTIVKSPKQDA